MAKASKESVIIIVILVVIIIAIKLALAWIQFNRFWFWLDVILFPLSFIGIILCVIFLFREGWDDEELLTVGGVTLLIVIITFVTINWAYNNGYSDEAIKTKANLEGSLETYTLILSIYTGEFRLKVEGMIVDELHKALCEASPEIRCEQVIKDYNEYQDLIGWKKGADWVVNIWR